MGIAVANASTVTRGGVARHTLPLHEGCKTATLLIEVTVAEDSRLLLDLFRTVIDSQSLVQPSLCLSMGKGTRNAYRARWTSFHVVASSLALSSTRASLGTSYVAQDLCARYSLTDLYVSSIKINNTLFLDVQSVKLIFSLERSKNCTSPGDSKESSMAVRARLVGHTRMIVVCLS